jgi:glycosyltransferase involved in cell wall biosynthesis
MISGHGISIIICCHNSAARLKPTLTHIARQNIPSGIACELIIVDNVSSDDTAHVACKEWESLTPANIGFKIVSEDQPGLAYAKRKGISESAYSYLIFCDDDNWLMPDYAVTVFNFFEANPKVGVAGGIGEPAFDEDTLTPEWFNKFSGSFALGPQAPEENTGMNLVYGAGMAIKREALDIVQNKHFPEYLSGRKGRNLTAGEDGELCYQIKLSGYLIAYTPALKFRHYISPERLNWSYIKRLHEGFAASFVPLDLYQRATLTDKTKLPAFYWLKKMLYYWSIYLKYWPTHFAAYSKYIGTIEEIRHITWRTIAMGYLKYNFDTVKMYKKMVEQKSRA